MKEISATEIKEIRQLLIDYGFSNFKALEISIDYARKFQHAINIVDVVKRRKEVEASLTPPKEHVEEIRSIIKEVKKG